MVKEKPNSTRIYDEEGFRQRAACICVKNELESEVLLVSSSRHSDQWIIPGGGVEPEETPSVAAIREVIEEAGVRGNLDRCIGVFENEERRHRTAVYVMIVTEELAEWDDARNIGRKRKWFTLEEALEQLALHKPVQLHYLDHLRPTSKVIPRHAFIITREINRLTTERQQLDELVNEVKERNRRMHVSRNA